MTRKKRIGEDGNCLICGKPHPRCQAHRNKVQPPEPCGLWPVKDAKTCKFHGGLTPLSKRAQLEVQQRREAEAAVRRFAARVDLDPTDALLDLVQYQAGVVAYWREQVEKLSDLDLVWGTIKKVDKMGGLWDELTETTGARPNLTYLMLREAQQDLASYAAAALKAGIAERQVRIAEQQGELFAQGLKVILGRMFDSMIVLLRAKGVKDAEIVTALTNGWAEAVSEIVPQELRAIAARAGA